MQYLGNCKIRLFVDNTNLLITEGDLNQLEPILINLSNLSCYFNQNTLVVNFQKTQLTQFHAKQVIAGSTMSNITTTIDNNKICQVVSTKFLGFIININLDRNKHVKSLIEDFFRLISPQRMAKMNNLKP